MHSRTVSSCSPADSCITIPTRWRQSEVAWAGSTPSTSTSPASRSPNPSRISIVVVFPAPFGPRKAKISPWRTSRSTPATASTSPKERRSPLTRIAVSMAGKLRRAAAPRIGAGAEIAASTRGWRRPGPRSTPAPMTGRGRPPNLCGMQIFRPDDQPDRPHGIMLLRNRLRPEDGKLPLRMRIWPVVSMVLILISGLIGTPTPALHGEGLVTLLGGGTLAALIAIELICDPQDDRAEFVFICLLGYASIALMTVQPSGTAVLGTYAAVASAVIRLPKRWALAAIVPIIAIVDIGILVGSSERFLVFSWTAIAYIFMFVIGTCCG